MKVRARCGYCILHRGYKMILRATDIKKKQIKAMKLLLEFLGEEYSEEAVPAFLGTERDRIIKKATGCPDPYRDLKRMANREALKILPKMERLIEKEVNDERLRVAFKIACLGNVIEYDVPDHDSDVGKAFEYLEEDFYIDDLEKLLKRARGGLKVLYLTDNAGEIAFDRLPVRELKSLGCEVTVAVKGGPSLNDALMEDAKAVNMTEEADLVITTGTDAIGTKLDESSPTFTSHFYNSDLILAKGMANWETLTETPAPCPIMYLFRTKCEPVAEAVEAPLHRCIAKLVQKGWKL